MTLKQILLVVTILAVSVPAFSQKAEGPNAKALEALTNGDFPGAVRVLDKDIADGKFLFESYRLRSDIKRMMGQFPGALEDANKAIALKSDDGRLYESRAQLRLFMGHPPPEIARDIDLAIAGGVKHERVYELRGMIRMNSGDFDGAISDYHTAISLKPDFARAYVGLSSAYRIKEHYAKAIEVLETFVAGVESSNRTVKTVKGEVSAIASVDLPRRSEAGLSGQDTLIYKQEVGSAPMTPEGAQRMAERLERTKNTAAAYINLAQLYEIQEQYPKALETVEKGLAIDRSDFFGLGVRGTIKVGLKDYLGAVEDLNNALRISQRSADFFLRRGVAYLMLGKDTEAESDFAKFLDIAPKGEERLEKLRNAALDERANQ